MIGKTIVNKVKQGVVGALAFVAMLMVAAPETKAEYIFDFNKLTNNNDEDIHSQLSFEAVKGPGPNQVRFDFRNDVDGVGGVASSVAEVYFDDDANVLEPPVVQVINFQTNFVASPVNPENLPGGEDADPLFLAEDGLSADTASGPGGPSKGINTSKDVLGLVYNISGEQDFNAVIAALNAGTLRSGLHVRSIGVAGGSDSYVSGAPNTGNPVPEPSTFALLSLGVCALALQRQRRKKIEKRS